MRKLSSIIMIALMALSSWGGAKAQEQSKHELSAGVGIGLSTLNLDLPEGDSKQKTGGHIGIGYGYYFSSKFSLKTGLEIAKYESSLSISSFTENSTVTDSEGESFILKAKVNNYKEIQDALYLNIPIMAQLEFPVLGAHNLYVAGGAKVGFNLGGGYKTDGFRLSTEGHYTEYGDAVITDLPSQGFYKDVEGNAMDEDLDYKLAVTLSLEAGMKWKLDQVYLYTGVFFDYGLNNILDEPTPTDKFYTYNSTSPANYSTNSLLASRVNAQNMCEKVNPFAVGLKLRLAFNLGK